MSALNLAEICTKLQSSERRPKIDALEQLQHNWEDPETTQIAVLTAFDECYLHVLKCYADRFESVREQAAHTVNRFVERVQPNDFHLLNIIATLEQRLGQQETLEESEELRLLFVMQLHGLMRQQVTTTKGRQSLQESYPSVVKVLVKVLRDAYPAVQREASGCVSLLARNAETPQFQQWSEQLALPLYGMLNHKHSQSRITAINALGQLALHINASGDALSRLLMEISPLLMDSMPLVRRACGEVGTLMLLQLTDRYSYFDRIIPLVLCCLKDDSDDVVVHIRPLWLKCGKLYYDENETELGKQELADIQVPNYPRGVQRPTIGCRGLVQRSLRLLKLITRESGDWKENVRMHSLKLLYQFVLHAEAAMTAKFFEIYPDVARACRDPELSVAVEAYKVADLMGRLFCYADWCDHGFDGLAANNKDGYLKCFYYMFSAAIGVKFSDLLRASRLLVEPEFSQTMKSEMQKYVLKLVATLQEKCAQFEAAKVDEEAKDDDPDAIQQAEFDELDRNAYVATIKVMALALDAERPNLPELQALGKENLLRIAKKRNITLADLHEQFFASALDCVTNLDAALDALSEPIMLLCGLIEVCKFRAIYMVPLQQKILQVWEHCNTGAKANLCSLLSITMLEWQDTINAADFEESVKLLRDFLHIVIEPQLAWSAGAQGEVMRNLATGTLCSSASGAPQEAAIVLPAYAKYFTNLLEEQAAATRRYALKCLFNFGLVPMEEMKPIAWSVLQRLDDPSSDIRELAVSVIPKLRPAFGEHAEHEREIWETYLKKVFDLFFLHYEGPDLRLKARIRKSLEILAAKHPKICKNSLEKALAVSCNSAALKELERELALPD